MIRFHIDPQVVAGRAMIMLRAALDAERQRRAVCPDPVQVNVETTLALLVVLRQREVAVDPEAWAAIQKVANQIEADIRRAG